MYSTGSVSDRLLKNAPLTKQPVAHAPGTVFAGALFIRRQADL